MHCRMKHIHQELEKTIRHSLISKTIYLELPSYNAMICAYNGIEHTIRKIVDDIKTNHKTDVKIDDYNKYETHKLFCITRDNNVYITNINLRVEQIDDKNQIKFQFYTYFM